MPRNNPGFDIDSFRENTGRTFIEVKGRIDGAEDFIITETEFSHGHTQGESFILALVKVAPGDDSTQDQIRYIIDPFKGQLPIWGAKAHVFSMKKFWEMGFDPLKA
jgi:molybdopterin synthase catalytic subunit